MLGSRLLPGTDVIAAFAPRVADEAAHAYESGGPQEFQQFERGLMGNSEGELYLIDGYGKDVLSRPIPPDSVEGKAEQSLLTADQSVPHPLRLLNNADEISQKQPAGIRAVGARQLVTMQIRARQLLA